MSLENIITACKKNDRKAQALLFEKFKNPLYFVSLKYCRNVADAEDNLHDTFVTIFEQIATYSGKGSFEGWMKRIAIFKAIDKYKAGKKLAPELRDDQLATEISNGDLNSIPIEQLLKSIQDLPDQYRLVFNLYQLDGFKHAEIGEMLNISENTSKSNYHRAKHILQKTIKEQLMAPKL